MSHQAKTDGMGFVGIDAPLTTFERQVTQERYISVGKVGDAHENASIQSFFAPLDCELIDRRIWETEAKARSAIFTRIEFW